MSVKWTCYVDGCDAVIEVREEFLYQAVANHLVEHGEYNRLTQFNQDVREKIERGLEEV